MYVHISTKIINIFNIFTIHKFLFFQDDKSQIELLSSLDMFRLQNNSPL